MLERYSHIRSQAKRAAIATLEQFCAADQTQPVLKETGHKIGHSPSAKRSGELV